MSARPNRPPPKPWSMKWIIAAIAIFIVGYTLVNVYLRKPGRAYRPYQDSQDRATTSRLLQAGWQKHPVDSRRPVEKPGSASVAAINRAGAGLGADLESLFAEKPRLLRSIDKVTAPTAVARGEDYTVYFTASLADLKTQVGELSLYQKGSELVLTPTLETLPGHDLKSRWNDASYAATFSTRSLAPGRYQIRITAQGPAAEWSFTVK